MIVLDSTTRKLQLVLATAKTANDMPYIVSYVDYVAGTPSYTPGSSNGTTNGSTAVDAVAAPAGSTQRQVKFLAVTNADTAAKTLKVRYNDNGTTRDFYVCTLAVGDTLVYADGIGFRTLDANSKEKTQTGGAGGRLVSVTLLTSASGTFTAGTTTNAARLIGQAGGGAGGGSAGVANGSAGGGGSAGGYIEKLITVSPGTGYSYTVGAGGTAGTAGNNPGNAGGNSTFVVGATTYTANGGLGGQGMAATTLNVTLGGASPAVSTNGDLNSGGQPGEPGVVLSAAVCLGGRGGSSYMGAGGNARSTQGAGNTATVGYGGGGAGGVSVSAGAATAGGAGAAGCWLVAEYT